MKEPLIYLEELFIGRLNTILSELSSTAQSERKISILNYAFIKSFIKNAPITRGILVGGSPLGIILDIYFLNYLKNNNSLYFGKVHNSSSTNSSNLSTW